MLPLLFAHLQLALLQDLLQDLWDLCCTERLLQIIGWRHLTFGYVDEHILDLHHFVQVGFDAGSPFAHLVLVACDFESFPALAEANNRYVGEFDLVGGLEHRHLCVRRMRGEGGVGAKG